MTSLPPISPLSSAYRLGARALLACALAALGLAGVGCFNPTYSNGGFKCSSVYEKECPSGFKCVNGLCWKGGVALNDGGGVSETKPEAPIDTPADKPTDAPVDKGAEAPCTIKPVMSCTPAAGKCDPQCQTGCDACHQKCSVNTSGALTCNVPSGAGNGQEGDGCEQVLAGSEQQTDDCAPGLVCVDRSCKFECAKLCRKDEDCPGSTCSRDYATGFKVCDVKAVDCNPVKVLPGGTRCPGLAQGCYLSSTVTDRTVCDCPFNAVGEGKVCKFSRDCLPGMACLDVTGTTDFRCRIVCSLTGATSGCMGTQMCQPVNGSTKFGYCRPQQ
jgi:hypothetical protein